MKKSLLPITVLLFHFSFVLKGLAQNATVPEKALEYIDPTIGNVGALLEPTRPTVSLPNQVVRMYPVRKDYMDDRISSFPLTMISHRLGEAFSIKPSTRAVEADSWEYRMPYDHNLEVTRPWYYS